MLNSGFYTDAWLNKFKNVTLFIRWMCSISVAWSVLPCAYSHLYKPAAICMYPARVQILLSHPPLGRKMVMMANRELTASRAQPPEQSTALVWGTQTQTQFHFSSIYLMNVDPAPAWLTLIRLRIFPAGSKFCGKLCVLSCSHESMCTFAATFENTLQSQIV